MMKNDFFSNTRATDTFKKPILKSDEGKDVANFNGSVDCKGQFLKGSLNIKKKKKKKSY